MQRGHWRWLVVVFGVLVSASLAAEAQDFTGVYKSSLGILTLKQTGDLVIGAFSAYDGVLEGKATGQRLTFTWRDGLAHSGTGEFVLSDDNKGAKGSTAAGTSPNGKPLLAARLTEELPPAGTATYWDYTETAEPLPGIADVMPPAKGIAELYIDGDKMTGHIAGRPAFQPRRRRRQNAAGACREERRTRHRHSDPAGRGGDAWLLSATARCCRSDG